MLPPCDDVAVDVISVLAVGCGPGTTCGVVLRDMNHAPTAIAITITAAIAAIIGILLFAGAAAAPPSSFRSTAVASAACCELPLHFCSTAVGAVLGPPSRSTT